MKTLSSREKIFVSLVSAAAIFALISLLHPTSSTGTANRSKQLTTDLNDFTSKLAIRVASNGITPFEAAAIQKAAEPWKNDPFLNLKDQNQVFEDHPSQSHDTAGADKLSYGGYLQMGTRTLAIIDGMAYEVGERLTDRPVLTLQHISPDKVVFVQTDTGATIAVPIETDGTQAAPAVPPKYSTRQRILTTGIKTDSDPRQPATHVQRNGTQTQ